MKILIYEDVKWSNLTPITLTKSVFELKNGFSSLLEKILNILPDIQKGFWVRDSIKSLIKKKYNFPVNDKSFFQDDLLLINGRWLRRSEENISISEERVVKSGEDIVYALIQKERVNKFWQGNFDEFLYSISVNIKSEKKDYILIEYPWDLTSYNSKTLFDDFKSRNKKGVAGFFSSQSIIQGSHENLYIEEGAKIHPFVVIDNQLGPVYIDSGAEIFPFSRIEGPAFIGKNTQIMPGTNIKAGCSFGEFCKIGGEVEESIFHSYTNKSHNGFIGHSYIGEFVNLGALTTSSNLKNDYTNVSVYLNGKTIDTKTLKVGSFIGDYTKTSIGTILSTGSNLGVMCNIVSNSILPKYLPSFSWYVKEKFMRGFGIESMIKTTKKAMLRRDKELLPDEELLIRTLYKTTDEERKKYIRKSRLQK